MYKKMKEDRRGFTLVELIVVIAILGVLAAVLVPQYVQYIEKAREAVIKQEAGEIHRAFLAAYTETEATASTNCSINLKSNSPIAKNTLFTTTDKIGRLSNKWYSTSTVGEKVNTSIKPPSKKPNYQLAVNFNDIFGFTSPSASIKCWNVAPSNNTQSYGNIPDNTCVFQVLFDKDGNIATEYYRKGYFVRIEGSDVESIKVTNKQNIQAKINNNNTNLFTLANS